MTTISYQDSSVHLMNLKSQEVSIVASSMESQKLILIHHTRLISKVLQILCCSIKAALIPIHLTSGMGHKVAFLQMQMQVITLLRHKPLNTTSMQAFQLLVIHLKITLRELAKVRVLRPITSIFFQDRSKKVSTQI